MNPKHAFDQPHRILNGNGSGVPDHFYRDWVDRRDRVLSLAIRVCNRFCPVSARFRTILAASDEDLRPIASLIPAIHSP
jgi:hypothetical protein